MAAALSIGSLNTHDCAKDRLMYLKKSMECHDFMLVEEHWLHQGQLDRFHSSIDNICAMAPQACHKHCFIMDVRMVAVPSYGTEIHHVPYHQFNCIHLDVVQSL